MLRIGQFCDAFIPVVDGVSRVVQAYADTLCAMGHQVTVSAPMYNTGYRGGYPYELVDYNAMNVPGVKQYKTGSAPMDAHYRKRMDMIPLDIVHAHSPFAAGTEALRIARNQKIPVICTFHSKFYDDFYKVTKSETLAQLGVKYVVRFMNRCDEVWAVSDSAAAILREYGYTGKILTIANGTTIRRPKPGAAEEAGIRFGLGAHPVLLYVGQMDWKKNILRILEAAALLKQSTDFRLVLAGQGHDKEAILKKTGELGLLDNVIFAGHIVDVDVLDGLYCRASIFTFPSLYDTAGLVVREAAVMGTPSVLVKGSSAAADIQDGVNGLLCRDDSRDLYLKLKIALADPGQLQLIGRKAQDTIPIPWEKVLTDVVVQYERLISEYGVTVKKSKNSTGLRAAARTKSTAEKRYRAKDTRSKP
jgi:1,2-diacylglycerol 3-alpha-glucosyltransferase